MQNHPRIPPVLAVVSTALLIDARLGAGESLSTDERKDLVAFLRTL